MLNVKLVVHIVTNELYSVNTGSKKGKESRYMPDVDQRVVRVIALLFHDHGTRRG